MVECDFEGLHASHGETSHGAMIAIGESVINILTIYSDHRG